MKKGFSLLLGAVFFREPEKDEAKKVAIPVFPETLLYDGQPIDPFCFDISGEGPDENGVLLSVCRPDDVTVSETLPRRPDAESGFVGLGYIYQDENARPGPFIRYKPLGPYHQGEAVHVVTNSGGSGIFSSLLIVQRKGDRLLMLESLGGGDRCNGGLIEATLKDGSLYHRVNATPYDLIILGAENEVPVDPYEMLEASAASCFATILYQDNLPLSVTLESDAATDQPGWTDKFSLQPCFNALQREYIATGRQEMEMNAFASFAADFRQRCLKI